MQLFLLTALCMLFFSLNAILCRMALITFGMEAFQYAAIRCLSGAGMLAFLCLCLSHRGKSVWKQVRENSSWHSALFLFLYMIFFSTAYVNMPSASGTLIQNTAVQVSMISWGVFQGMRPGKLQYVGLGLAFIGLAVLMSPGLSTPPLWNAVLMVGTGLMWGCYSVCGRSAASAQLATAGNFLRASCLGLIALVVAIGYEHVPSLPAVGCAIASGAVTSALGYMLWYSLVPRYSVMSASIIQLSVPPLTAFLGFLVLGEQITLRLVFCTGIILTGIFLTLKQSASAMPVKTTKPMKLCR